ncbi:MAG TPA: amidohydrolase family protein [Ilumatobacter sp.]|nr:amidohydrolase family protein [Ilumatobacter sp.]
MRPTSPSLLVAGGDVVTMNPTRDVLVGGTVAIDGDRIVAVGSTSELRAAYPDADVFDASGCVVTPGMIDAHQHLTGDPLVRSCIPDLLPPGASIFEWSVPLHGAHTGDDDEVSGLLSAVEALSNGVTTVVEAGTVAHPERVAEALTRVGLRATLGTWGWDIPEGPFTGPTDEVLDRQAAVLDRFPAATDGTVPLVEGWVTLVGHDLASDALLAGAADLARARGASMTMHLSPTSSDPERYLERTGKRPAVHLHDLGVLGPHLLLGHGVWLDDAEVELVLDTRTAIAYCPWAYLRLGQGVCANSRHVEIVQRGGRIALGCDATNAGDSIDILRTAAVATGIARDMRVDPTWFGAHQAFELATIAGAEAIGLGDRVGSLEVGKQADVVIHRTDHPHWTPRGDVGLQLVWGTDGRTVRDVFVAGRHVIADGRPTAIDHTELAEMATHRQARLLERAGISVPHVWPHRDAH